MLRSDEIFSVFDKILAADSEDTEPPLEDDSLHLQPHTPEPGNNQYVYHNNNLGSSSVACLKRAIIKGKQLILAILCVLHFALHQSINGEKLQNSYF